MSTTPSLREDQRKATRDRIVRAVATLVAEGHPSAVSVPAVARQAGVGVATVYRYFPTKEALLDAAARVGNADLVAPAYARDDLGFGDLAAVLPRVWEALADDLALARNQLASPVGRELRRRRWEVKRDAVDQAMRNSGIDPDSDQGRRLAAVGDVLTSSTALLELHDKADIPVQEAAEHVLWALQVLERATREDI
ncbi:MAG: TetR/AcrR family transcriptional regulator [Acidimicrobiales bacterium]